MKDYYSILGVGRKADTEEIKRAYRKLAHQHHPDKTGGDESRFKEINEAYYVLSDMKRRERYDRFGVGPDARTSPRTDDFTVFTDGFDSWFSEIMAEFFGGGRHGHQTMRGRDIALELTVTLEQALTGVREEVSVMHWAACDRCRGGGGEPGTSLKTCTTCSGAGKLHRVEQTIFGAMTRLVRCPGCQGSGENPETLCTTCRGSGRVRRPDRIAVTIPQGMEEGDTFMVEGGGDVPQAPRAGQPGALYVTVHVAPHPRFRREADDLFVDEEVSFLTLLRGGSLTVKGLDGQSLRLKVPSGTPSGKVFRVGSHGFPRRRRSAGRGGRGDLFVTLHARIPEKPSKRLLEVLKEFVEEF